MIKFNSYRFPSTIKLDPHTLPKTWLTMRAPLWNKMINLSIFLLPIMRNLIKSKCPEIKTQIKFKFGKNMKLGIKRNLLKYRQVLINLLQMKICQKIVPLLTNLTLNLLLFWGQWNFQFSLSCSDEEWVWKVKRKCVSE